LTPTVDLTKHIHHPIVGDMTIGYEVLALASTPGLSLMTYLAEPATPSADAMNLLRSPQSDHAYIFYFTHPGWQDTEMVNGLLDPVQAVREQRTSIHAARLHVEEGVLVCTRDLNSPVHLDPALIQPIAYNS
jgi:hypothetical protein